jgi:predicted GNAT family acetyltransferase
MSDANGLEVVDNQAASRFEVVAEDGVAELIYRKNGNRMVLVHTEVPEALGGRGIGGHLVQAAVDEATKSGMTIVPLCPYARSWLERHPDQAARVSIDWPESGS